MTDIEMIEIVDNNLSGNEGEAHNFSNSSSVGPIKVYGEQVLDDCKGEDLQKALNAAQDSLVKACLRIQELEQVQAPSSFDVMQLRIKLLKSKLAKSWLRTEIKTLKHQLAEAEELYSVMKKRNEELLEELKLMKLSYLHPLPRNPDFPAGQDSDPLPKPSKSATQEAKANCALETAPTDSRKFVNYFAQLRKRHSIIPRDLVEYWNSKMSSKLTSSEVLLFESKRLSLNRTQEIVPVFREFLDDLSRGTLDLNSFQNKKYRHFTPEAVGTLKREFESNSKPSKERIESLASELRVDAFKVRSWFRERRRPPKDQSTKKKQK